MTTTLKQMLSDLNIAVTQLASEIGLPYSTVYAATMRNRLPTRSAQEFRQKVDEFLNKRGVNEELVWSKAATEDQTVLPLPHIELEEIALENQMLTQEAMKHFKLFRNPFVNDIRESKDIFLNEDSRYVLAAMKDAARNQGILGVVGDSGAGKTVLRRLLLEELYHDGDITVIQPRIIDKTRATAAGLCDAIITDISSESPKRSMEAKARQVERLLTSAAQSGQRHVLVIEEAHDLTIPVLKYLKRFWELEDGFAKLLGIMLIGQTELKMKLDERRHYELREFIRRCMLVEMTPIDRDLHGYLLHKFSRSGADIEKVFYPDAIEALRLRLQSRKTHQGSMVYPQVINNLATKAMNMAAALAEERVSAEIIKEL